ncbi:MAG: tetratricopeptide repeat protein [Alphaproteobacteria bacterium]|nr:tetratricopeptide repeat protein [Alphaproteobacteria bacterium]
MSDDQPGGSISGNGEGGPMAQAVTFIGEGRLDEAKAICEQVLDGNGDNVDAIYAMGWIAFCQQDQETALAGFRRVIELNPEHARAHNNIGTILKNAGDAAAAGGHLEAAIAAAPDFTEAYTNLGAVRMILGEPNAARTAFEKAMDLMPGDPAALNNLATVKLRLGEVDEAIADYQRVVSLKPDLAEAHNNLAHALRRKGRMADAVESLERGLAARPDSAELLTNLGVTHYQMGAYETALADYERALAIMPDQGRARFLKAFPLLALERFEDGWAAYLERPGVAAMAEGLHREPFAAGLTGTTIALRSEGNPSDDLNFLRFVPELLRRGANILIEPGSKVEPLALTIDGIDGIAVGDEAGEGPAALDVALGDLPYLLRMKTPGDIPPPVRISPGGTGAGAMAARLKAAGPPPLIGVTWQRGERGGLPLSDLGAALAAAGGTIIMLQPGVGSDAAGKLAEGSGLPVVDFSDVMEDAAGALAVVSGLDAYVTVPNIGLALRQATGGAADVMVTWPPDYSLAGTGGSSPWFPRCRLHRAAPGADWQGALETLSHALAAGA